MVTTDDIEEIIVKLHKEHKTTREISKFVHKNFSYVGAVLRKRFPEEYADDNTISKETQALKLFSSGKNPTQVAIELNESPISVEKYLSDFWRLEGMQSLSKIYLENKKAVPNLLRLHKLLEEKNISPGMYKAAYWLGCEGDS
jgi:intein-encoded DNA endonuclease-like protein